MHGKSSTILHERTGVFMDLPDQSEATRYQSLAVERASLPDRFEISAWTDEGVVMGLCDRLRPVHGVQFHPESILTLQGKALLANFLALARRFNSQATPSG